MSLNQRNDKENDQIRTSDEEISENQRSDEENDHIRTSDEESDQNERSDEEISEERRWYEIWRDEEEPRCIVSDPVHPHNISRVAGHETKQDCFSCGKRSTCWKLNDYQNFHFYCPTCQVEFHAYCHELPSKMIHPYHPQHPLTFTFLNNETGMVVETNFGEYSNIYFNRRPIEFQKPFVSISSSNILFDKCTWCGDDLGEWFYRCLVCNFSLDRHCAKKIPPLTIQKPKSHHHSLSLFPRPLSFPCNACGLVTLSEPGYACYQCNYVVHISCIDLPRVIKITRHPHRLSHTPYLPTKVSTCRICYKNVDIKYGQYSCNHGDCSYVVHSKCATDKTVWDGEELEWEPEESDETKVIAPYKKVGPGLIEHFGHADHYLKLEKYNGARDSRNKCQACMRSITYHEFYSCIECVYFLHEVCANLPRQLDHAVHNHSLSLDPHPYSLERRDYYELNCKVCDRGSSGWRFICEKDGCLHLGREVKIDINCILVPECFTHESHPEHLLFIATSYGHIVCKGCKKDLYGYRLCCTICEFAICYKCSTIPNEVYYKFDEHLLSLCYGESSADSIYWCEVCEKRLNPTIWFYTDKEFCVTIHLKCLFGDSVYMKSGHYFYYFHKRVKVVSNDSSSRPTCCRCQHYCPQPVYFKKYEDEAVFVFCSFSCLITSAFNTSA